MRGQRAHPDPKDHPVLPGRPQLSGQVLCVSSEARALLADAPRNATTVRLSSMAGVARGAVKRLVRRNDPLLVAQYRRMIR